MALVLCIETATRICSVAVGKDGQLLSLVESDSPNSHASQLTGFISKAVDEAGVKLSALDAITVSKGPGSYTGLRIGVSTAKGICYALDKPLIAVGTLQAMALGMSLSAAYEGEPLFCPMIDARRMEVYMALYDRNNREVLAPCAEIITGDTFQSYLCDHNLILAGDGALKCTAVLNPKEKFIFSDAAVPSAQFMISLADAAFNASCFEDMAYFEPYYLKDFIAGKPKVKGL